MEKHIKITLKVLKERERDNLEDLGVDNRLIFKRLN
jgi:hypothetical protein